MKLEYTSVWGRSVIQCFFITTCVLSTNSMASNNVYIDKDSFLESKQIHWTGGYIGGVLGGLWGKNNVTWNPLPSPEDFAANTIIGKNKRSGFVGGILAGYNYQFLPTWLAGVEADWSWTNAKGKLASSPWVNGSSIDAPSSFTDMASTLNWIPSIRGRLGYLISPKLMVYGSAGAAWANLNYAANNSNDFSDANLYITRTHFSKTSLGYTVGGGLEWVIIQHFLLRAEYLYYQLSSAQSVVAQDITGNWPTFPSNYVWGNTSVNTVRVGLVYKF